MNTLWGIENHGGKIHINSPDFPPETILTIDIETDEKDNIVCVGLTGNGVNVYVYFNLTTKFFEWLRNKQLIGHDLSHAEIPWLKKYGFSMDNAYFDTKVGFYVWDSTRKNYGLKELVKDIFNIEYPTYKQMVGSGKKKVTLDKQDQALVAAYNSCDVFWTHRLYQWLQKNYNINQRKFLETLEWPTTKLLFLMEQQGIKVDQKTIRTIHKENSIARRKERKKLYEMAGKEFNPNSPKQLLPLLRDQGCDVKSTAEDVLKRFSSSVPFVSTLLEYRGLQKICSTYTIPLYMEAIKTVESRVYTRFGQNTITGRLSSSDPINLQNQPPIIRSCFVAKEGHSFVEADWSNLEWRIPGHFSGDPAIIGELSRKDGDIHAQTARLMFGHNFTEEQRKIAKTCNFLLTNSGRSKRLAAELGCSYKEGEVIFQTFWKGYSKLAKWTKETKEQAKKDGGISTMFGRWVSLPSLRLWCNRANCPVVAKDYFCKECFKREETEREAVSVRVQGSGADLIKLAMLRLYRDYGYVPVLTVHDSIMYEIKDEEIEIAKERIEEAMMNVVSLKIPLYIDIGVGKAWAQTKGK